jgi:uncharacterized protein YdeI (YjbR/CyaY-like superfamily)
VYLDKARKWQAELREMRRIVLDYQLTEELKWGKPAYTFQNKVVVILYGFKEYAALGFFKGALLKDAREILVSPGENSQSMRQIRFNDVQEIVKMGSILKTYIEETIEVDLKMSRELNIPEEFQNKLDEMPALKTAFEALTPGRQRAYALYFSGAKQSATRAARVEKCIPQILEGKGLNDC